MTKEVVKNLNAQEESFVIIEGVSGETGSISEDTALDSRTRDRRTTAGWEHFR